MVNVKFTDNRKKGLSDNGTDSIIDSLLRVKRKRNVKLRNNEENMKYTAKVEFIILCLIHNAGLKLKSSGFNMGLING